MSTQTRTFTPLSASGGISARPHGLWTQLTALFALRKQRRDLARLDTARLHDIGISAEDARLEAQRMLWDVPPGWRT